MKLSTSEPWMAADDYGRGLKGLGVNLLVRDVAAQGRFQREVLDAEEVYADADFAVYRRGATEWMLHANNPKNNQVSAG